MQAEGRDGPSLPGASGPPSPATLARLQADPEHWGGGFLYFCKADPRVWVPKRHGFGWTVNLAHTAGACVLLGLTLGVPLAVSLVTTYASVVSGGRCSKGV